MTPLVRFAPSPTGLLHVGNARTALINALFARRHAGGFVLRFDDTDTERSRDEYAAAIEADLAWLGIAWDRIEHQSRRLSDYADALRRLQSLGAVYPCYETPDELEFKRKRQRARGLPPVYDRAALALGPAERAALERDGRAPHWRLRLEGEITWLDLVRGPVAIRTETLSDPILVRGDGSFLYMLPSTVDDVAFGISHVIRGEDHVANTAVQIFLTRLLGAQPPQYAHVPLLTDRAGQGLSKRLGSLTLAGLRARGIEPMALASVLARLGTGAAMEPSPSLDALAAEFDLGRLARAAARFDEDQLARLNARYLQQLPYTAVADRLKAMGLERASEPFWLAVRPNLTRLSDAARWYQVCYGEIAPAGEDAAFSRQAAALLPPEPWGAETWPHWADALQKATGRRGKALFQPLRMALTGAADGPELKALLPLIGRSAVLARLRAAEA
jgi:glutamyl-tRNA synthetase